MGARSLDDEIAQVPSLDRVDRYFAPKGYRNNQNPSKGHGEMTRDFFLNTALVVYRCNSSIDRLFCFLNKYFILFININPRHFI